LGGKGVNRVHGQRNAEQKAGSRSAIMPERHIASMYLPEGRRIAGRGGAVVAYEGHLPPAAAKTRNIHA